jgi:hypothetical protein
MGQKAATGTTPASRPAIRTHSSGRGAVQEAARPDGRARPGGWETRRVSDARRSQARDKPSGGRGSAPDREVSSRSRGISRPVMPTAQPAPRRPVPEAV